MCATTFAALIDYISPAMGGLSSKSSSKDQPAAEEQPGGAEEGATAKPAPVTGSEPPTADVEQVDYSQLEENITTGDLAVLYREGLDVPHFAVFVQHAKDDPDFPLLLVKGKTKPFPKDKFNPALGRDAHTTSAVNRIFYGDYKTVLVRHLETDEEFPIDKVMENVEKVKKIPFTDSEKEAIKKATTPEERSALVGALMIAHFYKLMPVSADPIFSGDPSKVTPHNLQDCLKLTTTKSIKLPPVKPGPLVTGEPPLFDRIV